mgnify:FL=1
MKLFVNGHLTKILPVQGQDKVRIHLGKHPLDITKIMGGDKQHNEGGAKDDVQDNCQPQGQHKVKPPPSQEQIEINNQQQQTERSTVKKDALQLPDSFLPGKFSYVL